MFHVALLPLLLVAAVSTAPPVTFESLLKEMIDRSVVTRMPEPAYEQRQASSYNRESTTRDAPGWFADGDGAGFIREREHRGQREWVLLEHDGPGCLTKLWTPAFYRDLANHAGPNLRIYLDGADEPFLDEPFIALVTGEGSIAPPFAERTARAGNCYLPIPFAKRCVVTTTAPPFYYLINYRAYAAGTSVETLSKASLAAAKEELDTTARAFNFGTIVSGRWMEPTPLAAGASRVVELPKGPQAITRLTVELPEAAKDPSILRSTVLVARFDGEETIWAPVGDFFGSPDATRSAATWSRRGDRSGAFKTRWQMPYEKGGSVEIVNLASRPIQVALHPVTQPYAWDSRSLHFHARWRPDDIRPGTPFVDWNFVDVAGEGIYVGDAWTVLNPQRGTWWGEGDEKIYVDGAWDRGAPTMFGTGTEDYYGWAGGEIPTPKDEFCTAFVGNLKVGGLDGTTLGFNICTRERSLDAIPFRSRLRVDLESSFGTDIRQPWNHLGYSAMVFYYARPGATDNRPASPGEARAPIMRLVDDEKNGKRVER
ncbi:MAG: DUF2961 domain-containing protein [Phycisphaerae bacterium]|nr:DUF2961 domain-containing protein [Phycisphaerae bacterium]